ncbi:uncharacterized protein LOC130760546 [Actinidia eriantha]|uniref:uncharacterized protein LOC130760546 n=1 Tax=Actinidia eriantha TaxID=165200 RepID=UPI00258CE668|nr:uncharacterized protein LOC130760546 [Actinidia eriantha]
MLEIRRTELLKKCFTSLMEASVSLKEAQGEKEESGDDQDAGNKETDNKDKEECAKVDVALENGTVVKEGDMEEQEQDLELGGLEEVDQQSVVLSLIQRYPKFCYKDTHCLHKSSPVS